MAKIVLDFDGTIYSTAQRMIDLVKIHHPEAYKGGNFKDIKEFGFKPVLDLDYYEVQEMFNRKDFYIPEYVMDGALEFIKEYQLGGHIVEILTVGTDFNNVNKALLLEKLGLNIVLTCINTVGDKKISMDKGTYHANYNGITIYVDDRLECLETVQGFTYKVQFCEEGYVLDKDINFRYPYVTNWNDLYDIVEVILKKKDYKSYT
jgi:hypothetical protein